MTMFLKSQTASPFPQQSVSEDSTILSNGLKQSPGTVPAFVAADSDGNQPPLQTDNSAKPARLRGKRRFEDPPPTVALPAVPSNGSVSTMYSGFSSATILPSTFSTLPTTFNASDTLTTSSPGVPSNDQVAQLADSTDMSLRQRFRRRFEEAPPSASIASPGAATSAAVAAAIAAAAISSRLSPAPRQGSEGPSSQGDGEGEDEDEEARRRDGLQEERLVTSAWGKKYKTGHVPKSSHVGNLLPEEDLRKYTTLLPWNRAAKPAAAAGGTTAAATGPESAGAGAGGCFIDSSNIGHKLLAKMGWKAGKGLGVNETGTVEPVPAAAGGGGERTGILAGDMSGLGASHTWDLTGEEDVFEQYRKRMMLGYRHRPNPNNNPRKLYY